MDNKVWKEKLDSLKKNLKATKHNKQIIEDNIEELEFLIEVYKKKVSAGR